jgi:hypothetical protein
MRQYKQSRPKRERQRHMALTSGPGEPQGGAPAKFQLGSQEGRFLWVARRSRHSSDASRSTSSRATAASTQ